MTFPLNSAYSLMPESIAPSMHDDPGAAPKAASPRPDYDLHPLLVTGLEHYLNQQGDLEVRFHIR